MSGFGGFNTAEMIGGNWRRPLRVAVRRGGLSLVATATVLQAIHTTINDELFSVSCPSATSCTAAGLRVTSSGAQVTAAARWNGTSWALQNPPNPKGATRSQFNALSCPTTTVCEAVGMIHVNFRGLGFRGKTVIEGN